MAQCGGIGVGELNKLEMELCEQLHWKLLPSANDIRELLDALSNPQATFWAVWYNAPRTALVAKPADPEAAAEGGGEPGIGGGEQRVIVTKMPHARSMADSLGRFFRPTGNSSEGNLERLGARAAAAGATSGGGAPGGVASRPAGGGKQQQLGEDTDSDGSPRSVVVQRTFSLSNLFGLTSW